MRFFCGWLMGFLPYVATKCTANKKKKHPEKSSYTRYRQTLFFTIEQRQKRPPEQFPADFRAHQRCLLILPRHDQGRSNLCVVQLEIPNRSKNDKAHLNHLRHANKPKKKGMRIDSRKSQAGVNWNFAVALSQAKPFNTGETFCGPAGTKATKAETNRKID